MPNFTISPFMSLTVPTPGADPGPDYATHISDDLNIIDNHDHTPGGGQLITPAAININSDLPMNGHNLTLVATVRYVPFSSSLAGMTPNLGTTYVAGNELYYNDVSGNVVQLTNTGSVNAGAGSITGLPSGTASVTYSAVSETYVFQSATSTPGNLDGGSVVLRNLTANSKGLTLNPPNAMGADISETLPPANSTGSTVFLTYDTSNNMGIGPAVAAGILTPTGVITMYGGAAAPSGYILCDGSAVSRSTYSSLFTAIGTAYGVGNGTTTFNVPDLRGLFPRGVDSGAGNDPDTLTRTATNGGNAGDLVGSVQSDQFTSHNHTFTPPVVTGSGGAAHVLVSQSTPQFTETYSTGSTGGSETRPKNVYVNFIIKT